MLKDFVGDLTTHKEAISQLVDKDYAEAEIPLSAEFMRGVGLEAGTLKVKVTPFIRGHAAAFNIQHQTLILPILPDVDWMKLIAGQRHLDARKQASAREFVETLQRHIDHWFEKNQSIVVHELTHMFDGLRIARPVRVAPVQPRDGYFNDPLERNAFFQEMVTQLEERIAALPNYAQTLVVSSFEEFERQAEKTAAFKESWPYLTEPAQRRLKTRLWQTWQHLRNEE